MGFSLDSLNPFDNGHVLDLAGNGPSNTFNAITSGIHPQVSNATPYNIDTNAITGGSTPGQNGGDYGLNSVWANLQAEGANLGSQGAQMANAAQLQGASTVTGAQGSAAQGQSAQGYAAQGVGAQGNAASGTAAQGNAAFGNAASYGAALGNASHANGVSGNAAFGNAAFGGAAQMNAAQGGYAQAGPTAVNTSDALYRGGQNSLIGQLQQTAAGQGPSVAGNLLAQGEQQQVANQLAVLGSQRGSTSFANAQRSAANQNAQAQAQLGQQQANARIQEQTAAENQLSNTLSGARSQDQALNLAQANLSQQGNLFNAGNAQQSTLQNTQLNQQANQLNAQQAQQQVLANQSAANTFGLNNTNNQQAMTLANMNLGQASNQFNAQQGQQMTLANLAAQNSANAGNAQLQQQFGLQNTSNQQAMNLANLANAQQTSQANLGYQNQFGLNNVNNAQAMALANLGYQNQFGSQNLTNAQQTAQANLGYQNQFGLANLSNTQAANLANQNAYNTFGLQQGQFNQQTALQNQQAQLSNAQLYNQQFDALQGAMTGIGQSQQAANLASQQLQQSASLGYAGLNAGIQQGNQSFWSNLIGGGMQAGGSVLALAAMSDINVKTGIQGGNPMMQSFLTQLNATQGAKPESIQQPSVSLPQGSNQGSGFSGIGTGAFSAAKGILAGKQKKDAAKAAKGTPDVDGEVTAEDSIPDPTKDLSFGEGVVPDSSGTKGIENSQDLSTGLLQAPSYGEGVVGGAPFTPVSEQAQGLDPSVIQALSDDRQKENVISGNMGMQNFLQQQGQQQNAQNNQGATNNAFMQTGYTPRAQVDRQQPGSPSQGGYYQPQQQQSNPFGGGYGQPQQSNYGQQPQGFGQSPSFGGSTQAGSNSFGGISPQTSGYNAAGPQSGVGGFAAGGLQARPITTSPVGVNTDNHIMGDNSVRPQGGGLQMRPLPQGFQTGGIQQQGGYGTSGLSQGGGLQEGGSFTVPQGFNPGGVGSQSGISQNGQLTDAGRLNNMGGYTQPTAAAYVPPTATGQGTDLQDNRLSFFKPTSQQIAGTISKDVAPVGTPGTSLNTGFGLYNFVSDENQKTDKDSDPKDLKGMLDNLHAYDYEYKNPNIPGASPGRHMGIMAQDLEQSDLGRRFVQETPNGKMVSYGEMLPTMLASSAFLNERDNEHDKRLAALEAHFSKKGKK